MAAIVDLVEDTVGNVVDLVEAAGAVSKAVSPTINQATQAALGSTRLSTTVASVLNTSTTAAS
jgi:hypothetical protein